MTKNTKRFVAASIAVLSTALPILAGTVTPAEAFLRRSCKDVYVTVQNDTGKPIKVIDLDYWDPSSDKYRSEFIPNERIPNGQPWQETRNLEQIDQMKTHIRVEYRKPLSNGKWSKKYTKKSSSAVCQKNGSYTITLK